MLNSESLNTFAVKNTDLQVYWADETGRILAANPAACAELGYTSDEILSLTVSDIDRMTDTEDWPSFLNILRRDGRAKIETVHRRKDGSLFDVRVTISLFEHEGRTVICGLAENITERKLLELELAKSSEIFEAAVNTTSLGFWVLNSQGRLLGVNKAYEKASGYDKSELLKFGIQDLEAVESEESTKRRISDVIAKGTDRFRSRHRRKDGTEWPVEVVTSYSPIDAGTFFAFVEDITDKVAVEAAEARHREELEQSRELLQSAQRIARIGNWSLDGKAGTLHCSKEMTIILGIPSDSGDVSSEDLLSSIYAPDRDIWRTAYQSSLTDGKGRAVELRIVRATDGEARWVHVRWEHYLDAFGDVAQTDGTVQDITERKLMEQEIIDSRAKAEASNRSKSEFLANMSHDLRTPLNAILGFSEMMTLQIMGPMPEVYAEYATLIERSGKILLNAVNSILDLSKIEAGKLELDLEETDAGDLVAEIVSLHKVLADRKNIDLLNETQDMHRLRIDRAKVGQVLSNVIANAIKFTDQGHVTVENKCDAAAHRIVISDTGPGMTLDQITVAMQPFGQVHGTTLARRNAGTGLGLPISDRIMRLHGGSLAIDSKPGQGTSVILSFPSTEDAGDIGGTGK